MRVYLPTFSSPMDFLDKLNKQQLNAVTAGNGPILVVAGPGSGKTRVLTQRIAYLIAVEGVRPWQILAVTFTNKAAKEMGERLKRLLPDQATEGIMLGTFHSICARLLRRESEFLPIASNFVIFDTDDQERVVKAVIRELNINEKLYRPPSVHGAISRAKNELIGPDQYPTTTYRDEIVKRVYVEYQKRLIASNAVDFDDLLMSTARLLEDNPTVRDKYAQRFRHVLVDEFQDTNLAQYALVRQLASFHKNIFVVGDPDQSIYAWRGADWRNVQRFEQDFPEAQTILLEQNYRSRQNILNAAMGVIDRALLIGELKTFFARKGIEANWEAIEKADDESLVTALAMVCPFPPPEKQALLELNVVEPALWRFTDGWVSPEYGVREAAAHVTCSVRGFHKIALTSVLCEPGLGLSVHEEIRNGSPGIRVRWGRRDELLCFVDRWVQRITEDRVQTT